MLAEDAIMNPIAQYYRDELRARHIEYLNGTGTQAALYAIADEYIAWMEYRKKHDKLRIRIPTRGYLIRALS